MKQTLSDWLTYLETAHSSGVIDMGLERVAAVRTTMNLKPQCPVIIVGGTNGKGSVCAFLTSIYTQAGFKVGTLTSPHIVQFNERIRVNGNPVADEEIVVSFENIQAAQGDVSLTYFEYNTLAAVDIFCRHHVDVMVLEVGLGGRLDAVNIFDADCSVITNVDLDHQQYLGATIEAVAYEKAGIFRRGKPAVFGQQPIPKTLADVAAALDTELLVSGRDFEAIKLEQQQWSFRFHPHTNRAARNRNALPIPALRGHYQLNNAACALAAIECLYDRLAVDIGAIKRGLLLVNNPGRFQILPGRPMVVLDVGHNPHAARALRTSLIALPFAQRRIAVFAMLADKDAHAVIETVKDQFDEWYIAPLDVPRGMNAEDLAAILKASGIEQIKAFTSIAEAYRSALAEASENDRITVFGSFHTVAEVMPLI